MNAKNVLPDRTGLGRFAAAAAAALLLAGCANHAWPLSEFPTEEETRGKVDGIDAAQAAMAARHEGMLYSQHFDGDQLNSLGCRRLDLIVGAPEGRLPVVVYVDLPQDDRSAARSQAVSAYLTSKGLKDGQFRLESGPNTAVSSSAAEGTQSLIKLDNDSSAGAPAGASADSSSSGASMAK